LWRQKASWDRLLRKSGKADVDLRRVPDSGGYLCKHPGLCAVGEYELRGAVRDMARLAHVYAEATTPKVSVITGEAYGAAYIALAGKGANADVTLAWPSAVISALHPETAVALMYNDRITAEKEPYRGRSRV
jgi:acetyl-CoA carboxylase carboxyltransferase component